jgi:hypothetical protein
VSLHELYLLHFLSWKTWIFKKGCIMWISNFDMTRHWICILMYINLQVFFHFLFSYTKWKKN